MAKVKTAGWAAETGYIASSVGPERRRRFIRLAQTNGVSVREAFRRLIDRALVEGSLPDPRPDAVRDLEQEG